MKAKTILWVVVGVLALGMIGPSAAHKLGEIGARGAADGAKGATGAAVGAAEESAEDIPETVCPAPKFDSVGGIANGVRCALPISHPVDMANLARARAARQQQATPPTTMAPQQPEPPHEAKELTPWPNSGRPYVPPAVPAPPPVEPASDLPQLGEAPSGGPLGDVLSKVPAIGKALTEGLKALPPGEAP